MTTSAGTPGNSSPSRGLEPARPAVATGEERGQTTGPQADPCHPASPAAELPLVEPSATPYVDKPASPVGISSFLAAHRPRGEIAHEVQPFISMMESTSESSARLCANEDGPQGS